MDWVGLLIFLPLLAVSTILLVLTIKFYVLNKQLSAKVDQLLIDKEYALAELGKALSDIENTKLEKDDSFVKFLTTSREWAYGYIETVQKAMLEFDSKIGKELAWAQKYGMVNGENAHTKVIDSIAEAYTEFKEVMPDTSEDK